MQIYRSKRILLVRSIVSGVGEKGINIPGPNLQRLFWQPDLKCQQYDLSIHEETTYVISDEIHIDIGTNDSWVVSTTNAVSIWPSIP